MDIVSLLDATLRISAPLILVGMAGLLSYQVGLINIALEGMMLSGAFAAVVFGYELGSTWLGVLLAAAVGARGEVVACDVAPQRLIQVSANADRLGLAPAARLTTFFTGQPILKSMASKSMALSMAPAWRRSSGREPRTCVASQDSSGPRARMSGLSRLPCTSAPASIRGVWAKARPKRRWTASVGIMAVDR